MRTRIPWNRIGPVLALVLVVAPLVAQGSDLPSCPDTLPVADAAAFGCEPGSATIDDVEVVADDPGAHRDANGGLFVVDEVDDLLGPDHAHHHSTGDDPSPLVDAGARTAPSTRPPVLHSRPDASRVILLDVDGHTTVGTTWNDITGTTIVSAPFDLDGNTSLWSAAEQQAVTTIWQHVAEDFAPFDVDVTTVDPGTAGLSRSDASDENFGQRMVISPTAWYSSAVGGIAYVASFDDPIDMPAFVFSASLYNDAGHIAEAVSHEIGHTMGLRHDGTTQSSYYTGHGTWAPIMGVGYDATVVQWSRGEYPGANNPEDDLAVMSRYVPFAADDIADDADGARPIRRTGSSNGVIESANDVDAFVVDLPNGTFSATVTGAQPSPDLDATLELRDASGRLVADAAPTDRLDASLSLTVTKGRYTIVVGGGASGDPRTGWSDYGSLGRYTLATRTKALRSAAVHRLSLTTVDQSARVTVRVLDGRDRPVRSAAVTVAWSGSATGRATAVTNGAGRAVLVSSTVRSGQTVTATVVRITPPAGYRWDGQVATASRAA